MLIDSQLTYRLKRISKLYTTLNAKVLCPITIKVRFFASLRESVGLDEVDMEWADTQTPHSIWTQLTTESQPNNLLCAINQEYATLDSDLNDGDEVAFFPPVTGG